MVLSGTLYSWVVGYSKGGVELLLGHIALPVVHEVKDRLVVNVLEVLQVEWRMLGGVAAENVSKEWAAGRENCFVSPDLLIIMD